MHFHHFYWRKLYSRNYLITQLPWYLCIANMQTSQWLVVQFCLESPQFQSLKCLQTKQQADDHPTAGAWLCCDRATLTWRRESLIWKQLRITRHHYTTPLTGISNLLTNATLLCQHLHSKISMSLWNLQILKYWLSGYRSCLQAARLCSVCHIASLTTAGAELTCIHATSGWTQNTVHDTILATQIFLQALWSVVESISNLSLKAFYLLESLYWKRWKSN